MVEEPLLEDAVATPVPLSMDTKPLSDDHAPPASPPELLMVTTEVGFKAVEPLLANVPAFGAVTMSTSKDVVYWIPLEAHLYAPLL